MPWGAIAGAAIGVIGSSMAADTAASAQDRATQASGQAAADANRLARDQFDYAKSQDTKYAPYYDKLLQQQTDQGEKNIARSDEQWANYQELFQPIEAQVADDALTWNDPSKVAARRARAINDVDQQISGQKDAAARNLARSGLDAGSGRALSLQLDNAGAIARSAAGTKATNDSELTGVQLRANAASFGRNLPGTGLSASQAAINNGQAGSAAITTPQAAYNNTVGLGLNALSTGGSLSLGAWGQANQQAQQTAQTVGTLAGLGGKIAMNSGYGWGGGNTSSASNWSGNFFTGTNGLGTQGPVGGTAADPAYG